MHHLNSLLQGNFKYYHSSSTASVTYLSCASF